MRIEQPAAEDLLRETLRKKAAEAGGTLTLDDVRRSVADHRRRSARRVVALVAAAAAIAIGVPTALLLGPADEGPSPSPSPSPTPSGSPAPTPPPQTLDEIPRGAAPKVAYLSDGVVHLRDGGTTRFPAGKDVMAFTPYHGGWLAIGPDGLTQYDNTGKVVRTGQGDRLAVSLDQTVTAYQVDDHIHVGLASGMGEGEIDHPLSTDGRGPVGLLPEGVVYVSLPGAIRIVDDAGHEQSVSGLEEAEATSWIGDLISGRWDGGTRGRVVSVASDRVLWTSDKWYPQKFSADGKYVAAVHAVNEASEVAILDSDTGKVVASYSLADNRLSLVGSLLWDGEDDAMLFLAENGDGVSVLRLGIDGSLTRATAVEPVSELPPWVFATTP